MHQILYSRWALLFAALAIAVATYVALSLVERFDAKDILVKDPNFLEEHRYWTKKGRSTITFSKGEAQLENLRNASQSITQQLEIDTPSYVRFSIEAKGENILPDEMYWAGGSVSLRLYERSQDSFKQKSLVLLRESSSYQGYSMDVFIDDAVSSVGMSIRLLKSTGKFSVRNPSVVLLTESSSYVKLKIVLFFCWAVLAVVLCMALSIHFKAVHWISFGCLGAIAILGVMMPGEVITSFSTSINSAIPETFLAYVSRFFNLFVDMPTALSATGEVGKLGHLAIFFLIGGIVGWLHKSVGLIYGFMCIAVFALCTEALQMFLLDRTTHWADVVIDMIGGIFGLVTGMLFSIAIRKIQQLISVPREN